MFDKDLFLSLCDKYNVELSATNTEPMVRNKDGTYDSLSDRIKKEFDSFFNKGDYGCVLDQFTYQEKMRLILPTLCLDPRERH